MPRSFIILLGERGLEFLRSGGRKRRRINVLPCVLCCGDIRLPVQCDMAKSVAIDKLHGPIDQSNDALQTAETHRTDDVSLLCLLLLCYAYSLADHVDEGNDEGTKGDTAKGVGHAAFESAAGGATRHAAGFAGAEEPRAVDAGDGGVDGVFDPFADPLGESGISKRSDGVGLGRGSKLTKPAKVTKTMRPMTLAVEQPLLVGQVPLLSG